MKAAELCTGQADEALTVTERLKGEAVARGVSPFNKRDSCAPERLQSGVPLNKRAFNNDVESMRQMPRVLRGQRLNLV